MPEDLSGAAGPGDDTTGHPTDSPADEDPGRIEELLFDRTCQSESETGQLVREFFLAFLLPAPTGAVLLLEGEMGAGKTAFCRHLGQELGIKEPVNSPTFNLLHQHRGEKGNLCHYDLYRLDPVALEELEFAELWRDALENRFTLHAIEWWQKAGMVHSHLPVFRVRLDFDASYSENIRRLRVWRKVA